MISVNTFNYLNNTIYYQFKLIRLKRFGYICVTKFSISSVQDPIKILIYRGCLYVSFTKFCRQGIFPVPQFDVKCCRRKSGLVFVHSTTSSLHCVYVHPIVITFHVPCMAKLSFSIFLACFYFVFFAGIPHFVVFLPKNINQTPVH